MSEREERRDEIARVVAKYWREDVETETDGPAHAIADLLLDSGLVHPLPAGMTTEKLRAAASSLRSLTGFNTPQAREISAWANALAPVGLPVGDAIRIDPDLPK